MKHRPPEHLRSFQAYITSEAPFVLLLLIILFTVFSTIFFLLVPFLLNMLIATVDALAMTATIVYDEYGKAQEKWNDENCSTSV